MLKKEFGGTWRKEKVNWRIWEGGTTRVKLEEVDKGELDIELQPAVWAYASCSHLQIEEEAMSHLVFCSTS